MNMGSRITFLFTALLLVNQTLPAAVSSGNSNRKTPVVRVYEKTHESVVNISGERTVLTSAWPGFDLPQVFELWGPRYSQKIPVLGSGFIVHESGYIVTNAHVIQGTERIKVIFSNGQEYPARIINADQNKDLAVLSINSDHPLVPLALGRSDDLMIGETVIAIGNPYGYANTLTSGVISALSRDIQVSEGFWLRGLIQTDAPINPGNSGGPLLNINGDLIGITTAIKADAQNIGFAIPVDTLVNNISHMLMPEQLRRVRLGLTMGRMRRVRDHSGLLIDAVAKSSPADAEGLQAGDLILSLDGRALTSVIDFYVKMINKEIGEPIVIQYIRPQGNNQVVHSARLTIAPRPIPDGRKLAQEFFQMTVSELTEPVAQRFNFESAYPVLIITDVQAGGPAAQINLQSGDLILKVNHNTVRNLREFSLEMENVNPGDTIDFEIMRIGVGVFGQVEKRYEIKLKAREPAQASGFVF